MRPVRYSGLIPDWESSVVEAPIELGDILSMYTGGFTETIDKNGEEFGEARLLSSLRDNHHFGAARLLQILQQTLQDF
jgi:serine phosphatase RsbU (regulator of sigma subunit)